MSRPIESIRCVGGPKDGHEIDVRPGCPAVKVPVCTATVPDPDMTFHEYEVWQEAMYTYALYERKRTPQGDVMEYVKP